MTLILVGSLAFVSCSKDDVKNCASCEVLGLTVEACNNEDAAVTVTTTRQSETLTAEYLSDLGQSCGLN